MDTTGARIKFGRKEAKLSQRDLAIKCGWGDNQTRISSYESDRTEPNYSDIAKISKVVGLSAAWLAFGGSLDNQTIEVSTAPSDDGVYLPLLSEPDIAKNSDSLNLLEPEERVRLTESQLKEARVSVDSAYCVIVEGDQMAPALPDGAIAAFDTKNTTVKDGELYVVQYGPLVQVRVLERLPNGYRLKVFNDRNYSATEVKGDETGSLAILGRVFWYSVLR